MSGVDYEPEYDPHQDVYLEITALYRVLDPG